MARRAHAQHAAMYASCARRARVTRARARARAQARATCYAAVVMRAL